MIIRFFKNGGSFVGAGRYYLHDKAADKTMQAHLKPKTDERVWFTDTRNCVSQNPEEALIEMWRTAEDQAWLKKQAGVRTGGRPCEDPVKTFALAWHKDDAPTPEHMTSSADRFLKHMGWERHQAVFIGHRDTEHLHLHVILNRVHPETGKTIDDWREHRRASQWREIYEREQGVIRTAQRGEATKEKKSRNIDTRIAAVDSAREVADQKLRPANDHLPHNVVAMARPGEKRLEAELAARREADSTHWDQLKTEQREERIAWFAENKALIKAMRHAVYDSVRAEMRPAWREFYKEQKAAMKEAVDASDNAMGRALWLAKHGDWAHAHTVFAGRDSIKDAVHEAFAHRKAELKQHQTTMLRARQNEAVTRLREARDLDYKELLARQQGDRAALRAGQALPEHHEAQGSARNLVIETLTQGAANTNVSPTLTPAAEPPGAPATGSTPREEKPAYVPLAAHDAVPQQQARAHPFTLPDAAARSRHAIPLDAAAEVLAQIPATNTTHVALVGLALHHEYRGSDAARSLFAQWSAANPTWQQGEAEAVWNGIDPARADTAGLPMLIAIARSHGVDTKHLTETMASLEIAPVLDTGARRSETFASPDPQVSEPIKPASDLAAGAIGKVADYLADQLGELLAPTPPEVREARAQVETRRESERPPSEEDPASARARRAEGQVRAAEQERQQQQDRDWWTERVRSREHGRDR